LSDLLRGDEPDFLLLCSSQTALTGAPGQIDYTAANAFLDAFALQQRKAATAYTVSVNWPAWSEVGMAVDTEVPDDLAVLRAEQLALGIRSEEGAEAFRRILGSALSQVIVSPGAFDVPSPGAGRSTEGEAPGAQLRETKVVGAAGHARGSLQTEYVAPRNELERSVAQIWEELFGIDRLGIHDNFFELGGHSLLALQIVGRLGEALGVALSLGQFFDGPTVAEIAEGVARAGTREGEVEETVAEKLAFEQLSEAEALRLLGEK
jgi:acyl carrier protein